MKILVIGSGSREHALAWHFRQDPAIQQIFIAPGNAGTAGLGTNLPLTATDIPGLVEWAKKEKPDLTFVGPEAPLCMGIVDVFQAEGLLIFGPVQKAARFEASKILTKDLLLKYGIPTARARSFTDYQLAQQYSRSQSCPQVIKADGLASGKGVIIASNHEEAIDALYKMMEEKIFGSAGDNVLIEECLIGQEISVMVATDGLSFRVLPVAQDHKRLLDGDRGPNTGGMGAYAPAPFYTDELAQIVTDKIIRPTLDAFLKEGIDYQGILYVGLMLTEKGPQVLEFNVRLGDPETQVILPLLETPLFCIAQAIHERKLENLKLKFKSGHSLGVVLAAHNYPETPRSGDEITGLEQVAHLAQTMVFHGGTKFAGPDIVTNGGRVLTVSGWGETLALAREQAYAAVAQIDFDGALYRKDIGAKSL